MKRERSGLAAALPFLWLAIFFLLPFALVLKLSLSDSALAMPPYAPRIDWAQGLAGISDFLKALDFETYARLAGESLYISAYLSSLKFAAVATGLLLLIGYPIAYGIARCPPAWRPSLILAIILPFWTSFLIRIYALIILLKPEGPLASVFIALGLPAPALLHSDAAVYLGLVYAYLPFMVLPLYAVLERMDPALEEAASDLFASPLVGFWRVTFPMSLPGVAAGALLCFIPMVGEVVIPDLLGGSETLMLGKTIWTEFFANRDWPAASAVAVVLLLTLVVPIALFQRLQGRFVGGGR